MDISGIDYLGLDRVLRRGSGEIITQLDDALLIRDSISKAYFLACEDTKAGLSLLDRYPLRGCDLLMVSDAALSKAVFEQYGFSQKLECYQVAYYGEKPVCDSTLSFRDAQKRDLPMLVKNYHLISAGELEQLVGRRAVLLGYRGDRLIGFISEHLEGSMGMLYVFPEYRRRGFGAALQKHLIRVTMEKGYIPFGQVEKDNHASLNLQKKLGMTQSENLIAWMWKEP